MKCEEYVVFQCRKCKTTIIVPLEDLKRMELSDRRIACIFGHWDIGKLDKYADLKECTEQRYSTLI